MKTYKEFVSESKKAKVYVGGFADPKKADEFANHVEATGGKVLKRVKTPMAWDQKNYTHDIHYTHPNGPTGPYLHVKK